MNTRIRNFLALLFISTMVFGCSNSVTIVSSEDLKVVAKAKPQANIYLDAYDLVQKECSKDERVAFPVYIVDGTDSLDKIAFNCFDPNAEAEVIAEAEAETEIDVETESEGEAITEETPVEETTTQ